MNHQPMMISNSRMIPISQADYERARRHQPIMAVPAHAAFVPAAPPKAATMSAAEVKQKAARFDALMAEQNRAASGTSMQGELRRQGVDPKAREGVRPAASQEAPPLDGRALARASMEKMLRARGIEPVARRG